MESKNKIYFFDTTLRDGEQSPGVSLNVKEKLEIANQLNRLGIDIIEAGFPKASRGDFDAVKAVADQVRGPAIVGLARADFGDIDTAWEALKGAENPLIHIFMATSDVHLKYKLQKTREQVLEETHAAVKYAKKYCPEIEFSAEDAFRSDIDYLIQVLTGVIEAGATVVNIPDTVGYAVPEEYGAFVRTVIERVPNIDRVRVSVHCHDDLGMAVANSLAGISGGARQIEGTINGIGERAGNASLEEVIMALYTRKSFFEKDLHINYGEIYKTSKLVSSLTGMITQPNKAVVGKNAFLHESGIHQDGVLKERSTYEIMSAELIGASTDNIVLGKHSGRHAFKDQLQSMGYYLPDDELAQAFIKFKDLADKKKEITQGDLEALVSDYNMAVPEKYTLSYLQISSGTGMIPTATIKLEINNMTFETAAVGDGPVEAACRAVDRITDIYGKMLDYKLHAVGSGKDALGEVISHIQIEGNVFTGRGLSTDIIEASVLSYVNAINRYAYQQQMSDRLP